MKSSVYNFIILFALVTLVSCESNLFFLPSTIDEEVENMVNSGFDGTIVYVNESGNTSFYCAGWHNRENEIEVDPDALFKIGSISKLYIAAAASKIIVNQPLSLDDTLEELLPDIAQHIEYSDEITVRMLLQHRSGIPDYVDHPDYPWTDPFEEVNDTYDLVFGQPADFSPDKKNRYSNTNFLLLGEILDRTLGYSHHQYITDEILSPLGLTNTYNLLSDVNIDDVMSGYFVGYEDDIKYNDFIQPGGSMVATAEDVGIFFRALIDGTLLTAEEQAVYSMVYQYEHTGLLPGYQSIARYHEEIDAIVIQFANTSAEGNSYWNKFERRYKRIIRILKKQL